MEFVTKILIKFFDFLIVKDKTFYYDVKLILQKITHVKTYLNYRRIKIYIKIYSPIKTIAIITSTTVTMIDEHNFKNLKYVEQILKMLDCSFAFLK